MIRDEIKKGLFILKRDFQLQLSYRLAFFFQFFGVFISLATFYFIAKIFGPSASPYLQEYGGDYFSFVLIGLSLSSFLSVGLSSYASTIRAEQTRGTLEFILSSPTKISTLIMASAFWSFFYALFQMIIYLLFGIFVFKVSIATSSLFLAFLILILTTFAFSSLGILSASFIMVFKQGDPLTWVFSTFNSLLGGVFFPITVLPIWLQKVALFLPITHSLKALRLTLLQGVPIQKIGPDILVLILFIVVLLPLSIFCFKWAIKRAKFDGTLTHY